MQREQEATDKHFDERVKIAEKEKQFAIQMEEMKMNLEKQANEFYKELDELKENSFKKLNDSFVVELKKESKAKKPKDKMEDIPEDAVSQDTIIP